MKFLCIPCDAPMRLTATRENEPGSLSVVYGCPECGYEMAMLTNVQETQMVRSLGVRIGPAATAPAAGAARAATGEAATGRCPFGAMLGGADAATGEAAAASAATGEPAWTPEALARLEAIPEMVRPMARAGIEMVAREAGHDVIDETVLETARALRDVIGSPAGPAGGPAADGVTAAFARPYVVSWNLTYRCNLACEHCYLDAGPAKVESPAFADRSELSTEQCLRVVDEIAAFAPECVTILTGGEPLLRRDIVEIVRYGAGKGLWIVVGTNGVKITENLARRLQAEGVRGMALSLDALDAGRHDAFRRVRGAWRNSVEGARILTRVGLPFIVQTTVGRHNREELDALAAFAHDELGAKVWNLYFLVPSGRGGFVSDLDAGEYDGVLAQLAAIQRRWAERMLVNAKCAPHFVRNLLSADEPAPFPKSFGGGAGGCPAGTHYFGIRPNGDVTPCPYLPLFAGNLRSTGLGEIWNDSELFTGIRRRAELGGRCGACELQSLCGGCRARAYGMTGDVMAEDPLCSHEPGTLTAAVERLRPAAVAYGEAASPSLEWEPAARERMAKIPAFVRGMVTRAVESWCAKNGVELVTAEVLEEIRARMPTPKVFGNALAREPPPADGNGRPRG